MTVSVGSIWRNKRSDLVCYVEVVRTTARVPIVRFTRNGRSHALPRRLFVERYEPAKCRQCGRSYSSVACGPSHALVGAGVV